MGYMTRPASCKVSQRKTHGMHIGPLMRFRSWNYAVFNVISTSDGTLLWRVYWM